MAIQNRRGNYSDFDPSKMVEGEIAVVKNGDPNTSDGTAIYVSTSTGSAKRIVLHQDIIQEVYDAIEEAIPNYIDNSLTEAGMAADAKKTGDEIADLKDAIEQIEAEKADTDGTYPDMTVGVAQQLDSDNYTEDSEPYHFRKSGGGVRVGDREVNRIVGGTVAWNQLAKFTTTTIKGVTFTANADGSLTLSGTASANATNIFYSAVLYGHIILYNGFKDGSSSTYYIGNSTSGAVQLTSPKLYKVTTSSTIYNYVTVSSGVSLATPLTVFPQMIDLTAAFGSTIADYIYQLETATAGAGVAFVRKYIDIDTYHPYDAGTLKSVEGLVSHDMVGFNQWDEEWELGSYEVDSITKKVDATRIRTKNIIPILPSMTYYVKCPTSLGCRFVDANGDYISSVTPSNKEFVTPSNAHDLLFSVVNTTTYNHDICINLSDPAKNGTYEPYEHHSYPLDSTVTLRGVYKLVDGKLVANGDEYASDGTVTRRYGVVDLGTLTWAYQNGCFTTTGVSAKKPGAFNMVCSAYPLGSVLGDDKTIIGNASSVRIYITDSSYTDAASFKTAMNGVMLVYELTTPTTETAEPFTNPQWVDGSGTEQYISTSLVPIGHYTQYPENLKQKIEGLPWDFASLIAPTEAGYKATRAYSTGDLFIVNNILYKATTSIASGATITPNTNCTQTTLAAVIAAL